MKIKIYHLFNTLIIDEKTILDQIDSIPKNCHKKILNYSNLQKKQQRINSLQLLKQALNEFGIDQTIYNLETLRYTEKGKPFISPTFDFSIAYSQNFTILAFTTLGQIGIDIEKKRSIEIDHYKDYFTDQEWEKIHSAADKEKQFYILWTRKEALAKGLGLGFYLDFRSIEVLQQTVEINTAVWHLKTTLYKNNSILSFASTNSSFDHSDWDSILL